MDHLLELETGQPAAVQLGPGRPAIVASLAQEKSGKLLARPAQAMYGVEPCPRQIAHRLVPSIRNPHRRQLACPVQSGQAGSIPSVGLDPVAGSPGDQRGGNHDALMSGCRYLALDAVTAWPCLIAKPQAHAIAAKLAQQTIQRRPSVGDPAVLPDLAAQTARRHRDNDPFLVNIKPNVG
jgi:hypothetical protein